MFREHVRFQRAQEQKDDKIAKLEKSMNSVSEEEEFLNTKIWLV
jgi:hypothetical protein